MKICVISDSHMYNEEMIQIRAKWSSVCSYFFHCGDSMMDPSSHYLEGYEVVGGNNDFMYNYEDEIIKMLHGYKIFMTHGHRQYVKFEMNSLYYRAKEVEADIVLYGHTHIADAEVYDNVLFMNPGSIRYRSYKSHPSYAILDLDKKVIEYYDAKNHKLIGNFEF